MNAHAALDVISDRLQSALITLPSAYQSATDRLERAVGSRADAMAIIRRQTSTAAFADELARYLAALRYGVVRDRIQQTIDVFEATGASLSANAIQVLSDFVGSPKSDAAQLERVWSALLTKLRDLRALQPFFADIAAACDALAQHGAPAWALIRSVPATRSGSYHTKRLRSAWDWAANLVHLERIGASGELASLHRERLNVEKELRDTFAILVKERTSSSWPVP